jgi:hypothetical protein
MTVTIFPEPRFSMPSRAVIFAGTGASAAFICDEQRQSVSGQPHFGQTRPVRVE